eukprot:420418-Rhodomonas_salina.1
MKLLTQLVRRGWCCSAGFLPLAATGCRGACLGRARGGAGFLVNWLIVIGRGSLTGFALGFRHGCE